MSLLSRLLPAKKPSQTPGKPVLLRLDSNEAFTHKSPDYRKSWAADYAADYLNPVLAGTLAGPSPALYFGMDYGMTGDLSVFWLLAQAQDLSLTSPLVLEMSLMPFEQQQQLVFHILHATSRHLRAGAIDARGNGQPLAQVCQQYFGARVEQVMLSQSWYMEHMPRVKAYFEDGTLLIPKDKDILEDLRMVKVDKGVAKVPSTTRHKGRHGDAAVALALAVYASQSEKTVYAYHRVTAEDYKHSRFRSGGGGFRRR